MLVLGVLALVFPVVASEVDGFYWTDSAPDIVNSGQEEQGLISV